MEKSLRTGRFLLLVVGDGIRESVEKMLNQLQRYPQLHFTFGLVEMQIYKDPTVPQSRIVVPQLLAKTQEIVRSVVRIKTTGHADVSVELEGSEEQNGTQRRRTLSREEFFDEIDEEETKCTFQSLLDLAEELGAIPVWRSSSVSIQLDDPGGSRQRFSLLVLTTSGKVYMSWLDSQLKKVNLDPNISYRFIQEICDLFSDVNPSPNHPESLDRNLDAHEVASKWDDFTATVRQVVQDIRGSTSG